MLVMYISRITLFKSAFFYLFEKLLISVPSNMEATGKTKKTKQKKKSFFFPSALSDWGFCFFVVFA